MNKFYHFFLLSALVLIFNACDSTENKIAAFERFVNKVEQKAPNYTEKDWEKADATFKDFTENRLNTEKNNFTSEQMKKIGKLEAKYYKIRVKYAGEGFLDKLEKGWEYIKGIGEEITSEF